MPRRHLGDQHPPASTSFDIAPAPPQRPDARSTMFPSGLTHAAALRRTCLDKQLVARAIPAAWVKHDDPADPSNLMLCNVKIRVPKMFDNNPVCKAFEKELDRIEAKFRAGRKDKNIGGELGSIIVKRRGLAKQKNRGLNLRRSFVDGELIDNVLGVGKSHKRHASGSLSGRDTKRRRDSNEWRYSQRPKDHHAAYKAAVKEVAKIAKSRSEKYVKSQRSAKQISSWCAKEVRKKALKPIRVADEAPKRARRIVKQVLAFWRREDKERQEERKRTIQRADERRRADAEEREAQRQKNKLKFLLGQSESFSQFLQAKDRATVKVANAGNPSKKLMNTIEGSEDDDEIKKLAARSAADLVAKHQAKIRKFDSDTAIRKNVADENAAKLAANRELVRKALPNLKGVTEDERELLQSNELNSVDSDVAMKSKEPVEIMAAKPVVENGKEISPVRQPSILNCKMKDYQLRGLSWLVSLYDQGINGILADEMGLGKTLQTISLLAYLAEEEGNWGPFLVVTPKATLHNWQQEVAKFCPVLSVLPYWGNKNDRQELRKYWVQKRMYRKDSEFHVCITSYETLTQDNHHFQRVKWQYMILDEAQAIKNSASTRWKALLDFPCRNRLLLTGTPLQNKLSELWSLLHFIMPAVFDSHAEFADWFAKDIEGHAKNNKVLDASTLLRLRTLLDPFMLRRVKRDVESEMPPKTEVILHCDLSGRQRQLYAKVKANVSIVELVQSVGGNGADVDRNSKLMNIVMQLRKVCNHPETFERRDPVAPFQFQRRPPPFHDPTPPSVLTGGTASHAPLSVTLLTRSELVITAPRATREIWESLMLRHRMLASKYGIWNGEKLREHMFAKDNSSFGVVRLCGGISVGDTLQATVDGGSVWNWERHRFMYEDQICRLYEMYHLSDRSDPYVSDVTENKHRLLVMPRAKFLHRQHFPIILPGQGSPADIIQRDSRLLKSVRVFIPPSSAPIPELYLPGDISNDRQLSGPSREFLYPEMPRVGSMQSTAQVYSAWRNLFGNYGALVGTSSIQMPEAGRLIADSGKMQILDPLLKKLKAEGHKVLIYSQFTKVLDILEDYCGKTLLKHVRLDGQSALADRRDIVAEWQSNEELFVFLLSTRAGGVGLNLTAADTVIFFDSDWNPTQDLQAMDRAHRLGQERPVTVYRLISPGTIEERMLIRAQQKSRINDLVIKGGGITSEQDEAKDNEVSDIAALLMVEEEFTSLVDPEKATATAKNAVRMIRRK